jgi:capsular polysaccharide biosynthesis protein
MLMSRAACYNSEHPNIAIRRDQLISALFDREEVCAAMIREGRPTVGHQVIADGVAHKLRQMRDAQVHKGEYGRVAYNAVMMAAVAKVEELIV